MRLIRPETWHGTDGSLRHVDQVAKNPRIDVERVRRITYLHEFDRYQTDGLGTVKPFTDFQRYRELQGPTWGYPTEGAYYRDASSSDSLLAVRTPLFAIHAADDPVSTVLSSNSFIADTWPSDRCERSRPLRGVQANPLRSALRYFARRTSELVRAWRGEVVCQSGECAYNHVSGLTR